MDILYGDNFTSMHIIAYDNLPLDLSSREQDQLLSASLPHYDGNFERLSNAVLSAVNGCEQKVLCLLCHKDRDDYVAFDLGFPSQLEAARLFDIFMQCGIFKKPTHGVCYPAYTM